MKTITTGICKELLGGHVSELDEAAHCFHQSALSFSDFIQVEAWGSALCRGVTRSGLRLPLGTSRQCVISSRQSSPAGIVTASHFTDDKTEAENG